MKYRNLMLILWPFVLLFPFTIHMGCSRGSSTIIPDDATYDTLPAISDAGQMGIGSDRQLQGIYQMDEEWILNQVQNDNANNPAIHLPGTSLTPCPSPETRDGNFKPVFHMPGSGNATVPVAEWVPPTNEQSEFVGERYAGLHLNVRPFIATPLVYIRSWNPTTETLDVDVFIRNTSIYNGYDIRLIIFRDTIGHKLLNPDNYTHLWDIPEGTWSNGFIAYAKDNDHRILHAGEFRWERVQILCPGGNFSIKFAIDASWPSNCEEPYMMNNFTQGMLQAYEGATSDITVDVYDWQDNVDSVRIQCSAITGQTDTYMTKISGTKWGVELVNNNAVPEGDYFALIAATSAGSIDPLIHIVNVTVSPEVGNGWAKTWGGVGDDYGLGIAVDDDGNIFTVGSFSSTVDFNPDPIEEEIHSVEGTVNAFLSKFDSHGDFQWVRTWGGPPIGSSARAVEVDSVGNIYVGGISVSQTSHAPGAFLMKFDQDGITLWEGSWLDGNNDYIKTIVIDDFDNVFVAGYYDGGGDFDPNPTETDIHVGFGWSDAYVSKFDSTCDFKWAATWGSDSADSVSGISCDSNGNVYCAGKYYGSADFDPGPGADVHVSIGDRDAFLTKLDTDGNLEWANTWGGADWDEASDCAVDELNSVYVVGWFYYTVDFDPDPVDVEERTAVNYSDGFVSKFDSTGDFHWVFTLGNQDYDKVQCIKADKVGHFFLCGEAFNTDFDPGPGEHIATNRYLTKYSLDKNLEWVSTWTQLTWRGLALDSLGNCFSTGQFGSEIDFDPGTEVFKIDNIGGWDSLLIKLLPNGLWE